MIGLYEIAEAPPEAKVEKSMEVTGEVVGGAIGGFFGGLAAVSLLAFAGITSGGLIFVVVAVCASGGSIGGGEVGKDIMSWLVRTLK